MKKIKNLFKLVYLLLLLVPLTILLINPKADTKSDYLNKINELLDRNDLVHRFIGTSFMSSDASYNLGVFNPNLDKGATPYEQIQETPWYNVWHESLLRKIKFSGVSNAQAQAQLDDLLTYEKRFARKISSHNLDDGHYWMPFELYGVKNPLNMGYTVYDIDSDRKLTDEMNLLSGVVKQIDLGGGKVSRSNVIAKVIGNKIIVQFIADKTLVKDIKSLLVQPINGIKPAYNVFPATDKYAASFDITFPLGINPSDLVFKFNYVDKDGQNQSTQFISCVVNYDKALRSSESHQDDKVNLVEGISYQDYINTRLDNLIQRANYLVNNSPYPYSSEELTHLTNALRNLENQKANFNYETTNLKNFFNDAKVIYEAEYRNALKKQLLKDAKIWLDSIGDGISSIINPINFTEASVKEFKKYLQNLITDFKGKNLKDLIEYKVKIANARYNLILKPNYEKLEKLLDKIDKVYRKDLNINWSDDATNKPLKQKQDEIRLLIEKLKNNIVVSLPTSVHGLAKELVELLGKIKDYDGKTAINEKNPYDPEEVVEDPNANQEYTMEFYFEHNDPGKVSKYDYNNTLYKTFIYNGEQILKLKLVKEGKKLKAYFELLPITDSDGNGIFAISKIEYKNASIPIDQTQKTTMLFNDGVKQEVTVPRKAHLEIPNDTDPINLSINYYTNKANSMLDHLGKPKTITYDDCKLKFKQDTKHIIAEELNFDEANSQLAEYNKLNLTNIHAGLLGELNQAKGRIEDIIATPDTTKQDDLNKLVNKFKAKIIEVNNYIEFRDEFNKRKKEYNDAKATNGYTPNSLNEYEQILTAAEYALTNNIQDHFEESLVKLRNIKTILKRFNLDYTEVSEALTHHREEYLTLPSIVSTSYIAIYNILKDYLENQSASNQVQISAKVREYRVQLNYVVAYFNFNNLYNEKNELHNNKVASNKYTPESIAKARAILNFSKDALDSNNQDIFNGLDAHQVKDKLTNIDSIYELLSTAPIANGEYTVNVEFRTLSGKVSHANTALRCRARVVVAGDKITIYLSLDKSATINHQASGVIYEITFANGDKFNVEETKETTITYEGKDTKYTHPSLVSALVNYGVSLYKVNIKTKSPVFGEQTHDEEANLFIDWDNITKGFNKNEISKEKLSEYLRDLTSELLKTQSIIPNELKDKVEALKVKIKTKINDINLSPAEEEQLVNEAELFLRKMELYFDYNLKYQNEIINVRDSKNDNEIDKASITYMENRLSELEKEIKASIDTLVNAKKETIDQVKSKIKELDKVSMLARYNTKALKELIAEYDKIATVSDKEKFQEKITNIKTYLETCLNSKPKDKPSKYELELTNIIRSIKEGDNVQVENDPLLELRVMYFLLAKLNYDNKEIAPNSKQQNELNNIMLDHTNGKTNSKQIQEFINSIDDYASVVSFKEVVINKENNTAKSMLNNYLFATNGKNIIEIRQSKKINQMVLKIQKGKVSKLIINSVEAVKKEANDFDEFVFTLNESIKNEYLMQATIKAMGSKTFNVILKIS